MDIASSLAISERLQYLEGTQCQCTKKCVRLGRSWPHQECAKCHYTCSASMTAKQEKQLYLNTLSKDNTRYARTRSTRASTGDT
ncbi:hypothetical protein RU639_001261 [Aspergillus parasiticus]